MPKLHYTHHSTGAPVDLDKAGNYYVRHIEAMTAEGLYHKGDIAAELGARDRQIDELLGKVAWLERRIAGAREVVAKWRGSPAMEGREEFGWKLEEWLGKE